MELVKKHGVALILFILATAGNYTWNLIQKGGEAELDTKIDQRLDVKMNDGKLVRIFLKSDEITNFTKEAGETIRDEVIKDVMRKDTNKVSLRAIIGKGTNLRDENVPEAIIKVINDYNNGNLHCKKTHNLGRI